MKNLLVLGALVAASCIHNCAHADSPFFGKVLRHDMGTKGDVWAQVHASGRPWHGQYSYTQYGQPTALVVPPTAVMQQNYSWGVSQNTMTPIYHQFGPGAMPSAGGAFYGTPIWPSHTRQFGVYPVRAPW